MSDKLELDRYGLWMENAKRRIARKQELIDEFNTMSSREAHWYEARLDALRHQDEIQFLKDGIEFMSMLYDLAHS